MLGISALAQLPLAAFPGALQGVNAGPAWRRIMAQHEAASLNTEPPAFFIDRNVVSAEEEEIMLLLASF